MSMFLGVFFLLLNDSSDFANRLGISPGIETEFIYVFTVGNIMDRNEYQTYIELYRDKPR